MTAYDLIIIGAGPAGYVAAIRAAQLGMTVACIDKNEKLGGTCLNVGCIPSKALLHASKLYWELKHEIHHWGIEVQNPRYVLSQLTKKKKQIVGDFQNGIELLFRKHLVTFYHGLASLNSPTSVQVEHHRLHAKNILIATGSIPIELPFLPFDEKKVLSSTGALILETLPKKFAIIGAGIIGVELGSIYQRLGSQVDMFESSNRICPALDLSISQQLQKYLEDQGIVFHLSSKIVSTNLQDHGVILNTENERYEADTVLVAIGRKAFTRGLNLENIGVTLDHQDRIKVDKNFRTEIPTIYAIGDVIDGPMLAHKASDEAIAVIDFLSGKQPIVNYLAIPNVIYTSPEAASVGLTEEEATRQGIAIKVGLFPFAINSLAKCTHKEQGIVKIISSQKNDLILGVHICGTMASELIAEASLAIQYKLTTWQLATCSHAHPTFSEALKEAALASHRLAIHR